MFLTLLSLNYKVKLNLLKMWNPFRMQHTNIYSATKNNEEARQRASQSNRFNLWAGISDLGTRRHANHTASKASTTCCTGLVERQGQLELREVVEGAGRSRSDDEAEYVPTYGGPVGSRRICSSTGIFLSTGFASSSFTTV